MAVDHHEVEHLGARVHRHRALGDLLFERLVGAEQQLLAGLPARIEGARHLRAAERAVVELTAVLARERDSLGDALVDDLARNLRQPVDVGLARAKVAPLDGVVEEAHHRVAVVLVVLGRVDAALRGDAVGATGRILEAEALHGETQLAEGGGGGCAREPRADDEHLEAPLVGRAHQADIDLVPVPLLLEGAGRDLRIECHRQRTQPSSTTAGTSVKPNHTATAIRAERLRCSGSGEAPVAPSVRADAQAP